MSRRTKLLDKTIQDKIVNAIRAGNYIETAAAFAGIDKVTFYEWLKRGRRESDTLFTDFADAVERALAESEARDVAIITKASERNWQASAWRLERRYPDRWGRKDKVTVDADVHVTDKKKEIMGWIDGLTDSDIDRLKFGDESEDGQRNNS